MTNRAAEHCIYPIAAFLTACIAYAGFSPGYFEPLAEGALDKSNSVHWHVFIYVGWLFLFLGMSSLPMLGLTHLHRRIGPFAAAYGIAILLAGLTVTFSRLHDWANSGSVEDMHLKFLLPLTDMPYFLLFFGLALYHRRKPNLHKRLMVMTGVMLVFPGAVRIDWLVNPLNIPLLYIVWLSPLLLAIAVDAVFQKRFFPVYGWGLALLATMPVRAAVFDTPYGIAVTDFFAQLVRTL
jgi:uncharacterized membrane protein YhaH (DUF805 family)